MAADFSVNSTQLSDPQGSGTGPVSPATQQAVNTTPMNIISTIGDIFAKGLKDNAKAEADARKAAIIGEYIANERTYSDAMTSGQWNADKTAMYSRSNYMKMLAAHPEYTQELIQARSAVYAGTEISEAEKQREAAFKLKQADYQAASAAGYTLIAGEDAYNNKVVDTYKATVRYTDQMKQLRDQAAEDRAQASEQRAAEQHGMTVKDYYLKEKTVEGLGQIADMNYDSVTTLADTLYAQIQTGKISSEQAIATLNGEVNRIKAGQVRMSGKFPELASSWGKLFDDMSSIAVKRLDTKTINENEAASLKAQWDSLLTRGKLLAVEKNPRLMSAIVGSALFPQESMVTLAATPVVKEWLLDSMGLTGASPAKAIVGTGNDAPVIKETQTALSGIQAAAARGEDVSKKTSQAVNVVNQLLKESANVDGNIPPSALKPASTFYASPEFGKLVLEGKLDKVTASNVQKVFSVQYEPVVRDAIIKTLDQAIPLRLRPNQEAKVTDIIELKMSGGALSFIPKTIPDKSFVERLTTSPTGFVQKQQGIEIARLKEAENGLNQLVRMHAHLEGTTDYAKYWEDHKHELMPQVYPSPNKLKPGQIVNGYKYNGGNNRNRDNWSAVAN